MAINLESPDLRKKYKEGTYPNEGWEVDAETSAIKGANQVNRGLWS